MINPVLVARKQALEAALKRKTEELLQLCLNEAELTGDLPWETPLAPHEPLPTVPRRVGTGFSLRPEVIRTDDGDDADQVRIISIHASTTFLNLYLE